MGIGEFNSEDYYIYHLTKESEIQYLGAISKVTERSQFVSKANHSTLLRSKSMPQLLRLKKLK